MRALPAILALAALAVAACSHTPETTQASATPEPNALPETQGSMPQTSSSPSTAMGNPTPAPTEETPSQTASAESTQKQPCDRTAGGAQVRYADANNDGKVTKEEAKIDSNLVAVFDKYDKNHDGVLDHDEFQQLENDAQQRHPNRAEFAKAESSTEPCEDQQQNKNGNDNETSPGT